MVGCYPRRPGSNQDARCLLQQEALEAGDGNAGSAEEGLG